MLPTLIFVMNGNALAATTPNQLTQTAAELLEADDIRARVIDCYSVKPIDTATLQSSLEATSGRLVVAEDHRPEGGLGSAVTDALLANGPVELSYAHLAVRQVPGSGTGDELLAWAGIDAEHIADAARRLTGG